MVILALALSSCGAKVTTLLTLDAGAKGSRTMTATIDSKDSGQYLTGGKKALEASIQKNLPAALTYQGLKEADGKLQVTFALLFSSPEDYTKKITTLLKAGGSTINPQVALSINDSGLVQGLNVKENFTSVDLLAWMADGLVADGVVKSSDRSNIFEVGDSEVHYKGKVYKSSSSVEATDVIDNGFDQIKLDVSMTSNSGFKASVAYGSDDPIGSVQQTKLDAFFAKAKPENATLTAGVSGQTNSNGTTIAFAADDLKMLNTKLRQALGSAANEIKMEEAISPKDPLKLTTTMTGTLDCSAVCSPDARPIELRFHAPNGWRFTNGSSNVTPSGEGVSASSGNTFTIAFERDIPLQSAQVVTNLLLDGSVQQTITYTAKSEDAQRVGKAFEERLTPPNGIGSFSSSQQADTQTYTVVLEGSDSEDFEHKLTSYVPGATFNIEHPDGLNVWPEYRVSMNLPLSSKQLAGGVTGSYTSELKLPMLHGFIKDQTAGDVKVDGATLTTPNITDAAAESINATATGPTLGGLIFLGIMASLLLAIVILALIFRKRVRAGASRLGGRRDAAITKARESGVAARDYISDAAKGASSAVATAHAATQEVEATDPASQGATGPAEHASWSEAFTESDLQ